MEQFRTIPSSIYLFYFYFIFIFIFFYFLPHFFLFLTHFWTIRPSHHSMEQFRTIPSSLYLQTKSETSCQNTFPVDAHRRHPRVRYVVCDTKCAICRVRFVVCDLSCAICRVFLYSLCTFPLPRARFGVGASTSEEAMAGTQTTHVAETPYARNYAKSTRPISLLFVSV